VYVGLSLVGIIVLLLLVGAAYLMMGGALAKGRRALEKAKKAVSSGDYATGVDLVREAFIKNGGIPMPGEQRHQATIDHNGAVLKTLADLCKRLEVVFPEDEFARIAVAMHDSALARIYVSYEFDYATGTQSMETEMDLEQRRSEAVDKKIFEHYVELFRPDAIGGAMAKIAARPEEEQLDEEAFDLFDSVVFSLDKKLEQGRN